MKYYIYVSDSKVDMLLAQIPHDAQQKLAIEFKVDLKLFSASRRSEQADESNRFTRLEAVVSFIREYGNLGTIDQPNHFIDDSLEMQWGPISSSTEKVTPVYFGGVTEQTIFGMGGSMKHLIGQSGSSHPDSESLTPVLINCLQQEITASDKDDHPRGSPENWALRAVELATTQMKGPTEPLEFLAKRLLYGRGVSKKRKVLLASPLYVAMLS